MSQFNLNQFIHDIRNPLNNISMHAELGKLQVQQNVAPEKMQQTLETILQQCQRCSQMLDELKNQQG